jgi:DNA-binding transcriptional LysR family regulator
VTPPPAELAALVALVEEGSYRAAATRLRRSVSTVKGQVVSLRMRLGVRTTEQAIYVGTRRGWLRVHDLTD